VLFRVAEGPWQHADLEPGEKGYSARIECDDEPVEVLSRLTNGHGFSADVRLTPDGKGATGANEEALSVKTVTHRDYVEVWCHCDRPPSSLPVARVYQGSWVKMYMLQPAGSGGFRTTFVPETGSDPVHIRLTVDLGDHTAEWTDGLVLRWLQRGGEVRLLGERFTLMIKASDLMQCSSLAAYQEGESACPEGFTGTAGSILLEPASAFLDVPLEVSLSSRQELPGPKYGVFSAGGSRPAFLAGFGDGRTCSFRLRKLSKLVMLEDTTPPRLTCGKRLRRRPDGKAIISGKVADSGSGVDVSSIKAFVDGEVAIVSYDPDTGTIGGRTIKALQYGQHRFRLEAKDKLGNSAHIEVTADMPR
jgi:hypothetical protein